MEDLEEPLAMTSFTVRILDKDGEKELSQDEAYLHHLLISGTNIRNVPCPEYEYYNLVAGAGAELTDIDIPAPYAYKINPGDDWSIAIHVVNPSKHKEIEYILEYVLEVGNWTSEYTEVEGYLNSAAGCAADLDFDVPKDTSQDSFIIHTDFPSTVSGEFVFLGAHLHRGGKNMYLTRSTTGEVLFASNVRYGDSENPEFITSIERSMGSVSVSLLEPLRITGVYDCQKKHDDVMAILFGYVTVEEFYDGELPLPQVVGYDNPFLVPAEIQGVGVEETGDSPLASSANSKTSGTVEETEDNTEDKEDKAFLDLVSSVRLIFMFMVAVALLVAVVVLFRIKSKRSLEIFD